LRLIEAGTLEGTGGTLGVEIFEPATGMAIGLNRDRRFGHASSFKFSLAAMLLARDAAGAIDAGRRVMWSEADLMHVSPFTASRLAQGATLRELAEFTQKYSDNAAANILLRELGGPPALTAFWRSIGDDVSRLDRTEPALNNAPVTEYRDTTTPQAMARSVAAIIYGDVLPPAERAMLKQWMIDTPTGERRVRAGLPAKDWIAGDKTGTSIWPGMPSLYVDIGFAEAPKGRAPISFAAYFRTRETHTGMDPMAERVLMRVGRVIREFTEREKRIPFPNMFRQV
jgi:beta-lactamase class A